MFSPETHFLSGPMTFATANFNSNQPRRNVPGGHNVICRQRKSVALQLLKAEQLGAQQLRIPVLPQHIGFTRRKSEEVSGYEILLARTAGR
jgi:hypothetical protein